MASSFFKPTKPRAFNFQARYYDPDKERIEMRKRRQERKAENYDFDSEDFKSEMQTRWSLNRESNSSFNTKYTSLNRFLVMVLIAAVIIAIIVYVNVS